MESTILDTEVLGAMAAGTLDPMVRLMLQTRADLCSATRRSMRAADMIASSFFAETPHVAMGDGALERVMQRMDGLDAAGANRGASGHVNPEASLEIGCASDFDCGLDIPDYLFDTPRRLQVLVSDAMARDGWQPATERSRFLQLSDHRSSIEARGGRVYLMEAEAGEAMRRHRHLDEEYALVLKGAFLADNGTALRRGAMTCRVAGSVHAPRIPENTDCAMLVVMTGGVEYLTQSGI